MAVALVTAFVFVTGVANVPAVVGHGSGASGSYDAVLSPNYVVMDTDTGFTVTERASGDGEFSITQTIARGLLTDRAGTVNVDVLQNTVGDVGNASSGGFTGSAGSSGDAEQRPQVSETDLETKTEAVSGPDADSDGLPDARERELGTDVRNPDSDQDMLPDGREIELGTNPTVADTDHDGVKDGAELVLGTDPTTADTDGDGIEDGRELELGTNPTAADTDDDGIGDGRERELGTDPTAADTDGDGLTDGAELRNETVDGVPLPNADPLSMDLYVQVIYANDSTRHSDAFFEQVKTEWAEMPVENPDDTTGIDLHVRQTAINESVTFTGDNFDRIRRHQYRDQLGDQADVYHGVLVAEFATDESVGYGDVGGRFTVVANDTRRSVQRTAIIHELLHNVVGEIEVEGACEDHPAHWCDGGGWLRPSPLPSQDDYLPEPLAEQLESEGFVQAVEA